MNVGEMDMLYLGLVGCLAAYWVVGEYKYRKAIKAAEEAKHARMLEMMKRVRAAMDATAEQKRLARNARKRELYAQHKIKKAFAEIHASQNFTIEGAMDAFNIKPREQDEKGGV